MSEIKRYDLTREYRNNREIEEYPNGGYVLYEDFKKLIAENANLREALKAITNHHFTFGTKGLDSQPEAMRKIAREALEKTHNT